jgi:hypothetical protein
MQCQWLEGPSETHKFCEDEAINAVLLRDLKEKLLYELNAAIFGSRGQSTSAQKIQKMIRSHQVQWRASRLLRSGAFLGF